MLLILCDIKSVYNERASNYGFKSADYLKNELPA